MFSHRQRKKVRQESDFRHNKPYLHKTHARTHARTHKHSIRKRKGFREAPGLCANAAASQQKCAIFLIFTTVKRKTCTLLDVLARTSWSSMIFCTSPWKSLQVGHAAVRDNISHHLTFEGASRAQRVSWYLDRPSHKNPHPRRFSNREVFTILFAINCLKKQR